MHRRVTTATFDQRKYIASSWLAANLETELIGLLLQLRAVCMVSSLSLQATSKAAAHECPQSWRMVSPNSVASGFANGYGIRFWRDGSAVRLGLEVRLTAAAAAQRDNKFDSPTRSRNLSVPERPTLA